MTSVVEARKQAGNCSGPSTFIPNTIFQNATENALVNVLPGLLQPVSTLTTHLLPLWQHPYSCSTPAKRSSTSKYESEQRGATDNKPPVSKYFFCTSMGTYSFLATGLSHGGALPVTTGKHKHVHMLKQAESSTSAPHRQSCRKKSCLPIACLHDSLPGCHLSQKFKGKKKAAPIPAGM